MSPLWIAPKTEKMGVQVKLMNALGSHAATQSPAGEILNIAAYKFVQLDAVPRRRAELLAVCKSHELRGTILLSPEGINLFLAGERESVQAFLTKLRCDPCFSDLQTKDSYSDSQPFRRMLVRLKKEIIAFGIEEISPEKKTSPKLSAKELKGWLDAGRSVRLLDVRNNYEFDLGTFTGAEQLNMGHFREFPDAIKRLPDEAKRQPLVMFCTGGIRCEKAGPLMEQAGFEEVYQLDGGILKYFEECGAAHYHGSCFVFDSRVALDPELKPTGNALCFACQAVLTAEEISSDRFSLGQWCPRCYQAPAERLRADLLARESEIRAWAVSQPGSTAYENLRQIYVPRRFAGLPLIDFLDAWHPPTTRAQWLGWIEAGSICFGGQPVTASQIVKEGQCFDQRMPGTIEPQINANIRLIYEDDLIVIVHKPAPLPVHPSGRYHRNTLANLMASAYPRQKLRVAHRLDANTSGVVVLCRTYHAARLVQPQFSVGQVDKLYLARVHGHPKWDEVTCGASIGSDPQPGGIREVGTPSGLEACTRFKVVERRADGTSLVEARPLTGRTHQIRLHLWHLGFGILGDPLYLPDGGVGSAHTLSVEESPMCLHAWSIAFNHPAGGQRISFDADLPSWAQSQPAA